MPLYEISDSRPTVDRSAWIAPSADIIGDAHLAAQTSLWFGAVVRADNTPIVIGARSNIQEGSMLHSDPASPLSIGASVTIGHHAILHGCTIGDNCLIGMGATILNNAVIPENCLVGAGALVTEGKTFPPGSLIIGSPAKAVRALTPEQIAGITQSADHYVERSRMFAARLKRID